MSTTETNSELDALRALVEAQQEQIEQLSATVTTLAKTTTESGSTGPTATSGAVETATSRRSLLTKGLIAGAVGAAGATVATRPAAAANGDPLTLGETNTASATTVLNRSDSSTDGTLIVAAPSTATAIEGFCAAGTGLLGQAESGDAVFGQVTTGRGLVGNAVGSGLGLSAFSESGTGALVGAGSSGLPLVITPSDSILGPPTTGFHPAGALFVDSADRLYYNSDAGDPGSWVRLDTPAGVSLLSPPERAYDSRPTEPGSGPKGKFAAGQTRVIDLSLDTNVIDTDSGVVLNVTVTDTTNGGYAAVYSAAVPTLNPPPFASVNWTATGQTIGNNVQTAISDGKVKVFTIDAAHVIIDVLGFIL